jgi:hypothetical protein
MMKHGKHALLRMILGIALAFALTGCTDNSPGPDDPYDANPYGNSGRGWPSNNELSKYGIGGMSAPAGAGNIEWWSYDDEHYYGAYAYPVIVINFDATANTAASLDAYFTGKGWQGMFYEGSGYYMKDAAEAVFTVSEGYGSLVAGIPGETP